MRVPALALALLALVTAAPHAGAADRAVARTIAIDTRFDDEGGMTSLHTCSVDIPGLCQLTFSSAPVWTGTFTGTSLNRAYASYDPLTQELHAVVWEYFPEVTVAGCGTGTMMWRGEIVMTSEDQDPTAGGIVLDGTWNYVRGSGTGDLANITSGTFNSKDTVFTLPFWENHDDATGSLVCRTRRAR